MQSKKQKYILSLQCPDQVGIVAAVSAGHYLCGFTFNRKVVASLLDRRQARNGSAC